MSAGRRPLVAVALASLAIVAAVTLGLLRLYTASRDRLDEAMGERLLAVARATALGTDARRAFALSLADAAAAAWADSLDRRYRAIAASCDLAEVSLSDPEGHVLVSTSAALPPGAPHDWWAVDTTAVARALAGAGSASRLYRLQDTYQKSAHAPVVLDDPLVGGATVVAVVTVSGSPDFFDSLATLRRGAVATAIAVLIVLVAGGLVLTRQAIAVDRYRASLGRQQSLAAMGRMTAGIAHEIRNPLGIIRGAGEHLQRVLREHGIEDEAAGFIPEEVDRLNRILGGYLAFGRDDAPQVEVFDLATAVRRGVRLVADELAGAGVALDLPPALPAAPVLGDPRRVQQVLLNLLLNARDAMVGGGRVEVALNVAGGRAVIVVRDEGPGPGADPERLFEPFRTTKQKGSGLGLALSRQIVEDMGGELTLTDRADRRGAEARVALPLHAPAGTGETTPTGA